MIGWSNQCSYQTSESQVFAFFLSSQKAFISFKLKIDTHRKFTAFQFSGSKLTNCLNECIFDQSPRTVISYFSILLGLRQPFNSQLRPTKWRPKSRSVLTDDQATQVKSLSNHLFTPTNVVNNLNSIKTRCTEGYDVLAMTLIHFASAVSSAGKGPAMTFLTKAEKDKNQPQF